MHKSHLVWLAFFSFGISAGIPQPAGAQRCDRAIRVDCLRAAAEPLPGVEFAYGTTAEGDARVARLEDNKQKQVWRTTVGGKELETVEAVALRANGELLVAGSSTSEEIDGLRGGGQGGSDGIVFRLDGETGRLLGGLFVGGAAEETLTGVAEGGEGEVLVAGFSNEVVDAAGQAPGELIQVLPATPATDAPGNQVFVASLGRAAAAELYRHPLGALPIKKPRVWIDCEGQVVVGVGFEPLGAPAVPCNGSWPDLVYQQDQIAQNYNIDAVWGGPGLGSPPGGWGYHAMRWKHYHANATASPPFTLDWLLAGSPAIPKASLPTCGDAGVLNTLETQLFKQSGVLADPPGGWSCGSHADVAQLALFSAYLHQRWGTPVYTTLGAWDDLPTGSWVFYKDPVAIERTVFEPHCPIDPNAYDGERLEDLCDLSVNNVADLTCTTSSGVPGVVGTGFYLKLKKFEGAKWGMPLVWWGRLIAWNPDTTYFWQEWYTPGDYLMDPPEGSEAEVAILEAASKQLSGLVVRQGVARFSRIESGREACSQEQEVLLPASE